MTGIAPAQEGSALPNAAVIAHPEVGPSKMTARSVEEIFVGRRQFWADHKRITLVLVAGDVALHRAFCQQVLRTSPEDLARAHQEKKFRGRFEVGLVLASDSQDAARRVAATPGAIGYVRVPVPETVKVLLPLTLAAGR